MTVKSGDKGLCIPTSQGSYVFLPAAHPAVGDRVICYPLQHGGYYAVPMVRPRSSMKVVAVPYRGGYITSAKVAEITPGSFTALPSLGWYPVSTSACVGDYIYLGSDQNPTVIYCYSLVDGAYVTQWSPPINSDGSACWGIPYLAVGGSGSLYVGIVAYYYRPNRLQEFAPDGQLIKTFTPNGSGSVFNGGVCVFDGRVYAAVSRAYYDYIQIFTLDGSFVSEFKVYNSSALTGTSAAASITVTEDHIYISATNDQANGILKFSISGSFIQNKWMQSTIYKSYNYGNMVYDETFLYACGNSDRVYVIDPKNDALIKTITGLYSIKVVAVHGGVLYAFEQVGAGTMISRFTDLWSLK